MDVEVGEVVVNTQLRGAFISFGRSVRLLSTES